MQAAEFVPKRGGKRSRVDNKKFTVSKLVRPLGIETKFYDTFSHSTTPVPLDDDPSNVATNVSPADMDSFNAMPQGDNSYMRDGRTVTMKSIQLRGSVNFPATSTAGTITSLGVRLALVVDHQNNNFPSTVVWNTVFESSGFDGADSAFSAIPARLACMQFRTLRQSKRFTVLWDEMIQYTYDDTYVTTTSAGVASVIKTNGGRFWFHVMRDLNDMIVHYTTTNGNATDISDNNIMLLAVSSIASSGATLPTLDYVSRLRFRG